MAHHGGRTVPRAHRPRAPTMSVQQQQQTTPPAVRVHQPLQPLTAPLAPLRPVPPPPTTPVTLQAPRPDTERATNEYVETPFRAAHPQDDHEKPAPPPTTLHRLERPARLPLPLSSSTTPRGAVTKQPVAFTKEHPASLALAAGDCSATVGTPGGGNIICSECGRCRCESCRAPRPLPQRWVCDNACLCSADAVIDYASCLCCVKALYYHCSDSDAGATCADEPCSCAPHRRMARWACLGALAVVLPCLLCYWPLRGCQRGVEAAYARHSRAGCRCRPHQATPEKRLLDSSPEF